MGSVHLSRTRGNQPVALKVIRREFAQEQDLRVRFEREVQAARRVQGYHIVPPLDHDTSGEQPWPAPAFVPGLALDDALATYGPLPLPAMFQLIGCTAQALHSIHAASVVHRDLKPSNVLLGSNGPWVIDFGIARATDTTQLTRSGGFIGTLQYMSPEHALGRTVGAATDVFALGLIAAVLATGRHPYGDGAGLSIAAAIANTPQQAPDLSGYPEPLRLLLERLAARAGGRGDLATRAVGAVTEPGSGAVPDAVLGTGAGSGPALVRAHAGARPGTGSGPRGVRAHPGPRPGGHRHEQGQPGHGEDRQPRALDRQELHDPDVPHRSDPLEAVVAARG